MAELESRTPEQLLRQERARLRLLLERLPAHVVTVTRDLRIEFANSHALTLLGLPRVEEEEEEEELPEPWSDFSLRDVARELFEVETPDLEWSVTPAGQDRSYMVTGIPAHGLDTVVIVIRDVTESERLIRAEREFIGNAAHQLRTPLAAIVSAVDVLQLGAKEVPVERDRFLAHLERETGRLVRLVGALLTLARAQTLGEQARTELVKVRPLLEEVFSSLHTPDHADIDCRCEEGLIAITNRELMQQALANLCENALRYTSNGRIEVTARAIEGDLVLIDVVDTGPGLPPELRERVQERFVRGSLSSTGFGLGLAIASQAVDAVGGGLEFDSAPGSGTTARVTLPAARAVTV
jgi:signal transduction histidine kinase